MTELLTDEEKIVKIYNSFPTSGPVYFATCGQHPAVRCGLWGQGGSTLVQTGNQEIFPEFSFYSDQGIFKGRSCGMSFLL